MKKPEFESIIKIKRPTLSFEEIRSEFRKYEIENRNAVKKILIPYEYKQDLQEMNHMYKSLDEQLNDQYKLLGAVIEFY